MPTTHHEPSRGLGHEHDTASEDKGWEDLDTDGNEPGGLALAISGSSDEIGAVGDPVRDLR